MDTESLHDLITDHLGNLDTLAAAILECRDRQTIDGLARIAQTLVDEAANQLHDAVEECVKA
ncbi:hypothetical protein R0137_09740 [Congregibacter brevis]|uniref:Uncharacterized protein n=1 Tax=Congregibacter brevis TaxID=3081201 RepID=A0ABZ0IBX8_9GAMM|nr:hypothetical protein R0137_09740 [Congregibacter sp. IMCC45268]